MAHIASRAPHALPAIATSATLDVARELDAYVPACVRERIEQTYYARVSEQATLDRLAQDAAFLDDPGAHAALFSDHGVVHMRDVAARILVVLDTIHGVCIPPRRHERLEGFMKSYGVMLAYLHDIGMADLSPLGRATHAAFVAQAVFTPALDEIVEAVWAANSGAIAARLRDLSARGALAQDPATVWREMLALAMAHSKSCVPRAVLDRPARLRRAMLATLGSDLRIRYGGRRGCTSRGARVPAGAGPAASAARAARPVDLDALAAQLPPALRRFYTEPGREAFGWLVGTHPAVRELVQDVVDTLRALRCADALRQRGTALKTSGAYEVFVDNASRSPRASRHSRA